MALPIEMPSKVICVGLNYRDHAEESGAPIPSSPVLFGKWPSSLIGDDEAIFIPRDISEVDYEAELGIVIDREARDISEKEALSIVRGYLCVNDVSARAEQRRDGQWSRGKSFDTFGPIGPRLVPAADIPDPTSLAIECRVNDVTVQRSSTSNMIFSIPKLLSYLSRNTTLEPGDLIATGTPGGVGMSRTPPMWLRPGDRVEVEIEGIGILSNPVQMAEA